MLIPLRSQALVHYVSLDCLEAHYCSRLWSASCGHVLPGATQATPLLEKSNAALWSFQEPGVLWTTTTGTTTPDIGRETLQAPPGGSQYAPQN